jgi:hypothetical protein
MIPYDVHRFVNRHEDMVEWEKRSREVLGDTPRLDARRRFSLFSLFKSSGEGHRGDDAVSGD